MTEITSIEQFYDIVNTYKSAFEKTITNCFFMPEEISVLISQKRIFIKTYPEWLIIICKRDDYSNFYYYTTEDSSASCVKDFLHSFEGDNIYTDIVSRFGRGDLATPQKLITADCAEKYKTYQRMQLSLKDIDPDSFNDIKLHDGYKLSLDYCDFNALTDLWKQTLDEKSTPLPQKEELLQLCETEKLLTVFSEDNELAVVVMLVASSKQGLIQHLAVANRHRRKGLAMYLMNAIILKGKQNNLSAVKLWVDCNNSSAIALYNQLNFKPDGMLCEQLYMKGK